MKHATASAQVVQRSGGNVVDSGNDYRNGCMVVEAVGSSDAGSIDNDAYHH